jgi:nicotinamidase-related amidase
MRPAVVVVDLICGFTDPAMPLGSALDAEIEKTNEVLGAAHAANMPVFFTTVAYDDEGIADAGVWVRKQSGLRLLRAGTAAVELDPRLSTEAGDGLVTKKFASAFFGTSLVTQLNSLCVDTIVLAGCTTSGCVRASAVDALQYGYRPIVVGDAVGDRWPTAHAQSLFDLDQKYCDVMATVDVVTNLHRLHAQGVD